MICRDYRQAALAAASQQPCCNGVRQSKRVNFPELAAVSVPIREELILMQSELPRIKDDTRGQRGSGLTSALGYLWLDMISCCRPEIHTEWVNENQPESGTSTPYHRNPAPIFPSLKFHFRKFASSSIISELYTPGERGHAGTTVFRKSTQIEGNPRMFPISPELPEISYEFG